jgi:hypothetical protein
MIPYLAVAVFGAIIGGATVWLITRAERKRLQETVPTVLAADVIEIRDHVRNLQDNLAPFGREVILPLPEDLEVIAQVDADIAAGRSPF